MAVTARGVYSDRRGSTIGDRNGTHQSCGSKPDGATLQIASGKQQWTVCWVWCEAGIDIYTTSVAVDHADIIRAFWETGFTVMLAVQNVPGASMPEQSFVCEVTRGWK